MHKRHIELLALLLDATRSARAIWRRVNSDFMQTKLAGLVCSLTFRYPMLVGEENVDPDVVEVRIGNAFSKFYCGSEGFDLAREIVAAADEGSREQDRKVLEQLDGLIRRIRKGSEE